MADIVDTLERDGAIFTGRELNALATDYDRIERMRSALLMEVEALLRDRLHREAGTDRLQDLANGLLDSPLSSVVEACNAAPASDGDAYDGRSRFWAARAAE